MAEEKRIDPKTLAANDGREGRPTYIACGGRVVDVTTSRLWKGGRHMGRHDAGRDLTADIAAAPHGTEVLDRFPLAGRLAPEPPTAALPPFVSAVLSRWPMLRRHPHPAAVHFPIVFCLSAPFFSVLYLATGLRPFDATAFYCLVAALVFMPVGITTGLATWRINYLGRPLLPVTIKRNVSFGACLDLAVVCAWRAMVPTVLENVWGPGVVYLLLVVALAPGILVVAYYGGLLTFPVEST